MPKLGSLRASSSNRSPRARSLAGSRPLDSSPLLAWTWEKRIEFLFFDVIRPPAMASYPHPFWKTVLGVLLLVALFASGSSAGLAGDESARFAAHQGEASDDSAGEWIAQSSPHLQEHLAMGEESDEDDDLGSHSATEGSPALGWRCAHLSGGESLLALPRRRYLLFCCLKIDC